LTPSEAKEAWAERQERRAALERAGRRRRAAIVAEIKKRRIAREHLASKGPPLAE